MSLASNRSSWLDPVVRDTGTARGPGPALDVAGLRPSILITHDLPLEEGVRAYDMFKNKTDSCSGLRCGPGLHVGG